MLFSKEVERVGEGGRERKGNEDEKKKRDLERYFSLTNNLPALRIISRLSLLCHFPPELLN